MMACQRMRSEKGDAFAGIRSNVKGEGGERSSWSKRAGSRSRRGRWGRGVCGGLTTDRCACQLRWVVAPGDARGLEPVGALNS